LKFDASRRLKTPADYRRVFADNRRVAANGFVILAAPGATKHARLGIAISRRCARTAVLRNRLKRVARESFRAVASYLPPLDIVVVCRRGNTAPRTDRLSDALTGAWEQLGSMPWPSCSSC
jgi:ribonuclease P protein component